MAKGLKRLVQLVSKEHGLRIIPTFDDGITPGTIVEVKSPTNVNPIGHLTEHGAVTRAMLKTKGPKGLALADLTRSTEIDADAAVVFLKPSSKGKAAFKKAKKVVLTFGTPEKHWITWAQVSKAIHGDGVLKELPAKTLLRKSGNFYIVSTIIKARITFEFHGTGNALLDLTAEGMKDLASANIDATWKWDNKTYIESKKIRLVAVELLKYRVKKDRLESAS